MHATTAMAKAEARLFLERAQSYRVAAAHIDALPMRWPVIHALLTAQADALTEDARRALTPRQATTHTKQTLAAATLTDAMADAADYLDGILEHELATVVRALATQNQHPTTGTLEVTTP